MSDKIQNFGIKEFIKKKFTFEIISMLVSFSWKTFFIEKIFLLDWYYLKFVDLFQWRTHFSRKLFLSYIWRSCFKSEQSIFDRGSELNCISSFYFSFSMLTYFSTTDFAYSHVHACLYYHSETRKTSQTSVSRREWDRCFVCGQETLREPEWKNFGQWIDDFALYW